MMAKDRGLLNTGLLLRNGCLWQNAPWKENSGSPYREACGVGWVRAAPSEGQSPLLPRNRLCALLLTESSPNSLALSHLFR